MKYLDHLLQVTEQKYAVARFKQWLNYLAKAFPDAQQSFEHVKRFKRAEDMWQYFEALA